MDRIKDLIAKTSRPVSTSMSGGIGSGHGMVPFDDDMIVSKPAIVFHTSQAFFNFLAMACFASIASFQAKWDVGPSGLTGFAIFLTVAGILLSLFMLLVPVICEKYDKLNRIARILKELRVSFILTGAGVGASLLIAFIVTISAWTEPGCKNPDNDPNASKGDGFKTGLANFCNTKKAGAIFLWFTFAFWTASLVLLVLDMRSGKLLPPRDPPFTRPAPSHEGHEEFDDEHDDEESAYHHIPPARRPTNDNAPNSPFADTSAPAVGRPSMDAYGAFSDPAPSGFGRGDGPPMIPEVDVGPRVSRTMQYADPYAAVRATIAGGGGAVTPPSYESYQGYR